MGCGFSSKVRNSSSFQSKHESSMCFSSFFKIRSDQTTEGNKIVRKLGSGAFSSVFLCESPLKSRRALKVVPRTSLSSSMKDKAFKLCEAKILSELDHPNIIKCFGVYEKDRHLLMSSEFMAGGTLIDYLETVPRLTTQDLALILSQILSALVYCHDRGIIHRDIKLENVFVSNYVDLHLKIADFGLAVVLNKGKKTKGAAGTLVYMAPEVYDQEYDQKADIWSLGVLFYMIIFGKLPYHAKNTEEMQKKANIGPLFYNWLEVQHMDQDLFNLLQGLLAVNPKARLSARDALNHVWLKNNLNRENAKKSDFSGMAKNLAQPCKLNKLQKNFAVFVIWKVLDSKFFYSIEEFFKVLDKDGNGTIDKNELMAKIGSFHDVEIFFEEFDLNQNGIIEFTEFALAVCDKREVFCEKFVKRVFREIDKKLKGFLKTKQILKFFGVDGFGENLNRIDRNSKIFYEDFKKLLLIEDSSNRII